MALNTGKKDFYNRFGDEGIRTRFSGRSASNSDQGDGAGFGGAEFGFGGAGPGSAAGYPFPAGAGGPDFSFTDPFDLFARLFADPLGAAGGAGGGLRTDAFGRTVVSGPGFQFTVGQPSLVHLGVHVASQIPPPTSCRFTPASPLLNVTCTAPPLLAVTGLPQSSITST